MRVRVVDGSVVHECGLCGAQFGERRAVEAATGRDEARERGVAAAVWPLVRALEALPGVAVRAAAPGGAAERALPRIEFVLLDAGAMVQLENLAKSLRLATGSLRCRWCLEVEYEQVLRFVLRPRGGGGSHADALLDVATLAAAVQRDSRLGWWRHAKRPDSG